MTERPWHYVVSNLADLWEWMESKGEAPGDPYAYLADPQNWEKEWKQMLREESNAA